MRKRLCAAALHMLVLYEGSASAQRLPLFAPLDTGEPIGFSIVIDGDAAAIDGSDQTLCRWALDDWARATGGVLQFEPADDSAALIEIHFVPPQSGQYGEMRPQMVNGRRGAAVYIRPDTNALGPGIGAAARADPLLRDTIVYMTCLHELGHALGLEHTDQFEDIMYFFGYGGDIGQYFGRFREQLSSRDDISGVSGLSADDNRRVQRLYSPRR